MVVPHESDQRAWLLKGKGHIMASIADDYLVLAVVRNGICMTAPLRL